MLRATEKPIQDDLRLQDTREHCSCKRFGCPQSKQVITSELGIDRESVRRIFITDLHLYPYQMQIKHKLTPDDMRKCVTICEWFCGKLDEIQIFLDNVWFSDKAHFLLPGHVNSKNNLFWGSAPPEHCLQRPLHSTICAAWVLSKHGIIGPYSLLV